MISHTDNNIVPSTKLAYGRNSQQLTGTNYLGKTVFVWRYSTTNKTLAHFQKIIICAVFATITTLSPRSWLDDRMLNIVNKNATIGPTFWPKAAPVHRSPSLLATRVIC